MHLSRRSFRRYRKWTAGRGGSYLLCYIKSPFYRVGMCTAIDLHMKYMRDRLLVKTSCEIFNEAEQEWENNCGLGE